MLLPLLSTGEQISGEQNSFGEQKSGDQKSEDQKSGHQKSGDQMSGDQKSGDQKSAEQKNLRALSILDYQNSISNPDATPFAVTPAQHLYCDHSGNIDADITFIFRLY